MSVTVVVDVLSRIHEVPATGFWILSMPQFKFLDDLKQELSLNPEFISQLEAVQQHPNDHPNYNYSNGLLFHKGRIWLNKGNSFIPLLLEEFHKSPIGGHMGLVKTLCRLEENFIWPRMLQDVSKFIKECADCLHTKYIPQKPQGLLQPIPPPNGPWEDLSLDFITGLPLFQGFSVILVVVDRFSKGAHFGLLPTHFTAHKVAVLFLDMVCKLHGFPKSLISDRDPVFMSNFWRELFKPNGTKLRMSTAYYPQSDGQTEVLNRVLEQYLRVFVHQKPSLWGRFFGLAEWCYNTTNHSATGLSPFQVTYGKPPPNIHSYIAGTSSVEAVDSLLADRTAMLTTLRNKLLKAQQQMKLTTNANRRDVSYAVGDWVYVKLRPYRQVSLFGAKYHKLGKRYYGPYKITEAIGPVAF